jgi:nicotinamidase-related amidase
MPIHNGVAVPTTLADVCRPDRMALLVYDMQVGILRQVPDSRALLPAATRAVAAARRCGMRIVYMRHTSPPLAWTGAFQMRMALAWQRKSDPAEIVPWFPRGAPDVEIAPELAPTPDDAVLDKITMSAFEGTPLAMMLRDCGLIACAIIGAAIEIGIEPTVRHAADLGIVPVLLRDACAGGNKEEAARALASMEFMGDAMFASVDEFETALVASAGHTG